MTDPIVVDDALLDELRQQAERMSRVPVESPTLLALIARIEALEADNEKLTVELDDAVKSVVAGQQRARDYERQVLVERIKSLAYFESDKAKRHAFAEIVADCEADHD